jgi:hypothetical protein
MFVKSLKIRTGESQGWSFRVTVRNGSETFQGIVEEKDLTYVMYYDGEKEILNLDNED